MLALLGTIVSQSLLRLSMVQLGTAVELTGVVLGRFALGVGIAQKRSSCMYFSKSSRFCKACLQISTAAVWSKVSAAVNRTPFCWNTHCFRFLLSVALLIPMSLLVVKQHAILHQLCSKPSRHSQLDTNTANMTAIRALSSLLSVSYDFESA